jgi:hypothetical protein
MSDNSEKVSGKGRPTPPRKEQEMARKKPLVGDRSKASKIANKQKVRDDRNKSREGLMAGDEKYLTMRDRGPQRRHARNVVDIRFTMGEIVLPALLVVVMATFIDSYAVQLITLFGMWAIFLLVGVDAWLVGRAVKKSCAAKFGAEKLEGGLAWYGAMRSIQMRPLRIPKPQVKRFTKLG